MKKTGTVITGPQDENNVFDPEDLEINDESYNNANVMVILLVLMKYS